MKKKATLLIQHLEQIYPMVPKPAFRITKGFLAIHHDEILGLGEGSGSAYIDKDTRILDGWGRIAVPGFIDISCALDQNALSVNECYDRFVMVLKHGTMILNSEHIDMEITHRLSHNYALPDVVHIAPNPAYPMVSLFHDCDRYAKTPFCISMNYPQQDCLDQLLCAKWYANTHPETDVHQILAACTLYPAQALSLPQSGYLKKGAKANVLLLKGACIEHVLHRFHGKEDIHIIKDGVRIYPSVLV